eukprot:TRINITY_DN1221_c0_g1_i2.p3 TRINITY_DN1221_c0_g1~~TRINITY_DN1221_c0_g1_i2.p3  ORF type:complete len:62 (+),score=4.97 TRINITY_DN1221_c0_g1_i2:190-375(+)
MTSDAIQSITFQLCYMFYNWTGSIRVPAPVQCAHTLAHMHGTHIKQDLECRHIPFEGQYFL